MVDTTVYGGVACAYGVNADAGVGTDEGKEI